MKNLINQLSHFLQTLGRSMLLAISVMPCAAILNRISSDDMLNILFLKEAAWTIFAILPILFAVSVAGGITKDKHIAAGVSSVVVYEILVRTLKATDDSGINVFGKIAAFNVENNILIGIIAGIIAGFLL
ncbi:MAG: PTS transporter subunit EIIC [Tissierellia bacterium]|nr:PTS transporter subunit EIIC [Tissierellia bacterium]